MTEKKLAADHLPWSSLLRAEMMWYAVVALSVASRNVIQLDSVLVLARLSLSQRLICLPSRGALAILANPPQTWSAEWHKYLKHILWVWMLGASALSDTVTDPDPEVRQVWIWFKKKKVFSQLHITKDSSTGTAAQMVEVWFASACFLYPDFHSFFFFFCRSNLLTQHGYFFEAAYVASWELPSRTSYLLIAPAEGQVSVECAFSLHLSHPH